MRKDSPLLAFYYDKLPSKKDGGPGDGKKPLPPIYVNDPNDPRLRAHDDSTYHYLKGLETEKFLREHGFTKDVTHEFPFSKVKEYGPYANKPKPKDRIQPISAVSQMTDASHPSYYKADWVKYKKPDQPVIYQPSLKKMVSKMEPISTQSSYTPSLRIPNIPNVELPSVQRGKYRASYWDPEMKDWNERAFMSQQESDQFANEMLQRGYAAPYGNITQRVQYKQGGVNTATSLNYHNSLPKVKNGGDISIPDLQESRWLMKYGPGGATTDGCKPYHSKNAKGECVPEWMNFRMPANRTDVPITIQEKQKKEAEAEEFNRRNRVTAKRQFVGPARLQTDDEKNINEQKKRNYTYTHPNAVYNEQTGALETRNPDRDLEGKALPYTTAAGIDKGMEHFTNALEAAGYVEGAGALGKLGVEGLGKAASAVDRALYPTRVYRAQVPGGNIGLYSDAVGQEAELANKVFGKGDWATKDLSESFQYLKGKESIGPLGGKQGLLSGQDMNLTEYKVPFWKKNVSTDADVQALKKLQGIDINSNEYIIPGNTKLDRFLYPRRTNTLKAVPEELKLNDQFYDKGSIPIGSKSTQFASQPYKYVEDQLNAVTGHNMPITYTFDATKGYNQNIPFNSWEQPQFAPNSGIGTFKRFQIGGLYEYGPGGETTDGCPAGYYKHSLLGCIPIPGFQPVQKEQAQLKKSTPIAKGEGYGKKVDPYERIIAQDTAEKQAEYYSDLAKRAGVSAALAAGVVTGGASLPYLAPALEASLLGTLGAEYGTGALTAGNLINAGFAYQGAKNLPNVASAWKDVANKPTWGGVGNALGQTALTAIDILPFASTAAKGIPSVMQDVNQAGNYLTTQTPTKEYLELPALEEFNWKYTPSAEKKFIPTAFDKEVKKEAFTYLDLMNDPRYLERVRALDAEAKAAGYESNLEDKLQKFKKWGESHGKNIITKKEQYFPFNINTTESIPYVNEYGQNKDALGRANLSNTGFSNWVIEGDASITGKNFNPEFMQVEVNRPRHLQDNVPARGTVHHELKHQWTNALKDEPYYGNVLSSSVIPEESNSFLPRNLFQYYTKPTEIDAHVMTNMRDEMVQKGILKDHFDELSKDKLAKFIKENPEYRGIEEYFKPGKEIIWDRNKFMSAFNKALPAITPIGLGVGLSQQKKTGGKVDPLQQFYMSKIR